MKTESAASPTMLTNGFILTSSTYHPGVTRMIHRSIQLSLAFISGMASIAAEIDVNSVGKPPSMENRGRYLRNFGRGILPGGPTNKTRAFPSPWGRMGVEYAVVTS